MSVSPGPLSSSSAIAGLRTTSSGRVGSRSRPDTADVPAHVHPGARDARERDAVDEGHALPLREHGDEGAAAPRPPPRASGPGGARAPESRARRRAPCRCSTGARILEAVEAAPGPERRRERWRARPRRRGRRAGRGGARTPMRRRISARAVMPTRTHLDGPLIALIVAPPDPAGNRAGPPARRVAARNGLAGRIGRGGQHPGEVGAWRATSFIVCATFSGGLSKILGHVRLPSRFSGPNDDI